MVKIVLGNLKNRAQDIADFLGERVSSKPTVTGDEIVFEDDSGVKPKALKTYLKRFLHNQKIRDQFRIRVANDIVKIVEVKEE